MRKYLFLVVLLFSVGFSANATHLAGGDFSYKDLGNGKYVVTLNVYRDCSGATLPDSGFVDFESTCGEFFSLELPVVDSLEISQLCPSYLENDSSTCRGGNLPGMQQMIYQDTVELTPLCNGWTMTWSGGDRNEAITNVDAFDFENDGITVIGEMFNSLSEPNSSPVFTAQPIPYVCTSQDVFYSFGATDVEGDSLVYSLISGLDDDGTPLIYNGGYSGTSPIPGISIDPNSGEISFNTSIQGFFVVVVLITEYRDGVKLSEIRRDIQFVSLNGTNCNSPLVTSGNIINLTGDATLDDSVSVSLCDGNSFQFELDIYDPDGSDIVELESNISGVLPGATFTTTPGNPAHAVVTWTANGGSSFFSSFTVNAKDDNCPIRNVTTFNYKVTVLPATVVNGAMDSIVICGTQTAELSVEGGGSFTWSWLPEGDTIDVGRNFLCDDCDFTTADPDSTTSYVVTSNLSGACTNKDTITVVVAPDFIYTMSQTDTNICRYGTSAFEVLPDNLFYDWIPSAFLTNDSISNPAAFEVGTVGWNEFPFSVTSLEGCVKVDTFKVNVSSGVQPNIHVVGDTTVCLGSSTELSVKNSLPDGSTCKYTFKLDDSFGDGWNGAALDIFVSDTLFANISVPYPSYGSVYSFFFTKNDTIRIEYSSGDFDEESSYVIFDEDGNVIFSDGPEPTIGVAFEFVSNCDKLFDTYKYSWAPSTYLNDTSLAVVTSTPLTDITYTVIVMDSVGGCSDTTQVTVHPVQDFTFVGHDQTDETICLVGTVQFISVPEDTTNIDYTYAWSPSIYLNNDSIFNPTAVGVASSGIHEYTVTAENEYGCAKTDTFFVTVTTSVTPIATITGDSLLCPVELLDLGIDFESPNGNPCEYTLNLYEFFGDGWDGASLEVNLNAQFYGSYEVPDGPTFYTENISVAQGDVLELNFISGFYDEECAFELLDSQDNPLYQSGYFFTLPTPTQGVVYSSVVTCPVDDSNFTYDWSPGIILNDSTIKNPSAIPVDDTTYLSVIVLDPIGGCSDTATMRLLKIAGFTNTLTQNDSLICLGESINFTVSPDTLGTFTYLWSPTEELATNNTSSNQSNFTSGGYREVTVEVESDWGCTNVDTFYVKVSNAIIPNIYIDGNINVCYGDSNQLETIFSNVPDCNYMIEGADTWGDGWNSSFVEIAIDGSPINVFTVSGSSNSYSFDIPSGSELTLNYVDGTSDDNEVFFDLYDADGQLLYAGDGLTTGVVYTETASCMVMSTYTYSWTPSATLNDATIKDPVSNTTGNVTYQLIVTDTIAFCADTATHSVIVFNQLDAGVPLAGPFCEYDAAVTLQANTPGGTWLGVGITSPSTGTFNPNIANPGIHQVKYTVTNAACTNDSIINITVYAQPGAPIATVQSPYCKNSMVSGASLSGTGESYAWYSDRELTDLISDEQIPLELNQADSEKYIYFTQTKDGCVSDVDSVLITIVDVPEASISASPSSGLVPLEVVFTNSSTPTDEVTHLWSDNNNQTSSASAPTFVYEVYGEYTVVYTITNNFGCSDSDTLKITAEDVTEVLIPNVFTPNSTIGENDEFRVEGKNLANFNGIIYNRWGLKVFEWSDYEKGWSGERNPDGVYYYVITYTDIKGEDHKVAGHVTMIGSGN